MAVKSETKLIIFYVVYFVWLTIVTFLSQNVQLLDYFTVGIVLFLFISIAGRGDIVLFFIAAAIMILGSVMKFVSWSIEFDVVVLKNMPIWLPLSWGITAVALRKLYYIVRRHVQ